MNFSAKKPWKRNKEGGREYTEREGDENESQQGKQ